MIEIDRMSLTLPAAFAGRAEAVVRQAADSLAARAPYGRADGRRLNALPAVEVHAEASWTDAELGGAVADAIWRAARREGGPW